MPLGDCELSLSLFKGREFIETSLLTTKMRLPMKGTLYKFINSCDYLGVAERVMIPGTRQEIEPQCYKGKLKKRAMVHFLRSLTGYSGSGKSALTLFITFFPLLLKYS